VFLVSLRFVIFFCERHFKESKALFLKPKGLYFRSLGTRLVLFRRLGKGKTLVRLSETLVRLFEKSLTNLSRWLREGYEHNLMFSETSETFFEKTFCREWEK
jgi:hypothetical protein